MMKDDTTILEDIDEEEAMDIANLDQVGGKKDNSN